MGKSTFHRLRPAFVMVLALAAGCATEYDTTPTVTEYDTTPTATEYDPTPTEDATARLERWICGDDMDGCGIFRADCVVLTANLHNGTGEVKFSEFVERTQFQVQGIERRWDWCLADDYAYDCAFVISVDGTGRYYNSVARMMDGQNLPTLSSA